MERIKETGYEEGNLCGTCGSWLLTGRDRSRTDRKRFQGVSVPGEPEQRRPVKVAAPAVAMAGQPMEAAMVGTLLVCLGALVIAILGCAWIGPAGESQQDKVPDGHPQ
jgi:hypothetical protein